MMYPLLAKVCINRRGIILEPVYYGQKHCVNIYIWQMEHENNKFIIFQFMLVNIDLLIEIDIN
jgi:hypothetical protein